MSKFVRKSQFRHVFGQPYKRDKIYESIPISRASTENNMCAANPKFVAIITESGGGGSFLVLKLEEYGRLDVNHPRVCGHKQTVLDIAWCPHNDNVIASCSEDTMIKLWFIKDEGVTEPLTEAEQTLRSHQKKVLSIEWNPVAENILLSYAADDQLIIWDVDPGEALISIECHPSVIWSASWNPAGNLIGTTCKDKKLRIIDARTGDVLQTGEGFESAKCQKIKMLKNDKVLAVGATRMGQRQYRLYDRKDMASPMVTEGVDNGSNTFNIFYDEDLSMVYLAAKGDCKLLYYEVTDEQPYVHFLSLYQPKDATKGLGYMPKRGIDVNAHEVARFYRLIEKGICEPTSMIVPRKSELFQNDIYPPCASTVPSMTADEWVNGANKPANTMNMETLFKGATVSEPAKRSSRLGRATAKSSTEPTEAPKAEVKTNQAAAKPLVSRVPSNPPRDDVKSSQEMKNTDPTPETTVTSKEDEKKTLRDPPSSSASPSEEDKTPRQSEDKVSDDSSKMSPVISPLKESASPEKPVISSPKPSTSSTTNPQAAETLKNILNDFKQLRTSITDHDGRISFLEDLTLEQKKQIEELIAEISKLKATVSEQGDRIAKLESQANGQVNGD